MDGHPRTSSLNWLPNAITIARIAALPVLIWLIAAADATTSTAAACTFTVIGASDFVDGRLARALGAESAFGRIADPFADRMLMAVGLVGIIVMDRLPWPAPAIILARDALAIVAFVVLSRRGLTLHVDMAGKISSTVAMVAVGLALLIDAVWVDALFWFAAVLSVATFANYALTAWRRRISAST